MPKGSDQFAVIALNTGFYPMHLGNVLSAIGCFVAILAIFIAACGFLQIHGYQTTRREQAFLFDTANMRLDSLFGLMNSPTDVRGPPGPPGPMGPPGPPGACDPVGHITTVNGVGEITDHPPKPLKDDDPIVTDDTFEPGSELKEGEEIWLGENVIKFRRCMFTVERKAHRARSFQNDASNSEGCILTMQRDGNMVMYHPEKGAVWSSQEHLKGQLCPKGIKLTKDNKLTCQT
jgi:hypothetical protein